MTFTMEAPPIQYVRTSDGYNIAYTVSGKGPPLVLVPEPVSHIQIYWTAQTYMLAWLRGLAARFQLVSYDGRGQGMSSRGLKVGHSVEDDLCDLEAVIERLALEHFVLLSRSHAGVRYALRHPERVKALILEAIPASGSSWPATWSVGLARDSWELFLEMLASLPDSHAADRARGVDRLKQTTTQDDHLVRMRALAESDVSDDLPGLSVPTLVLHPRGYRVIPEEESMRLAALIPNARLVLIDGASSRGDAAQGIKAIEEFLREIPSRENPVVPLLSDPQVLRASGLSARQAEVLRLIARGKTTREIAEQMVLSERTVERHIADVYTKIGARNRAEATAYALNNLANS